MILGVAGMVGTGKTTLTRALAARFGLQTALESVDADNPWLEEPRRVALRHLPPPPEDGKTCGPGPFSMADPEVVRANIRRTPGWDSLATTNLIAAVEEEFGIQFTAAEIDDLNSFDAFTRRLPTAG